MKNWLTYLLMFLSIALFWTVVILMICSLYCCGKSETKPQAVVVQPDSIRIELTAWYSIQPDTIQYIISLPGTPMIESTGLLTKGKYTWKYKTVPNQYQSEIQFNEWTLAADSISCAIFVNGKRIVTYPESYLDIGKTFYFQD